MVDWGRGTLDVDRRLSGAAGRAAGKQRRRSLRAASTQGRRRLRGGARTQVGRSGDIERGTPVDGGYGRGTPVDGGHERGTPLDGDYEQGTPPVDGGL